MSRASNLAGFSTSIGPSPTDLSVGIVTAISIVSKDSYSFTNLAASHADFTGLTVTGVSTFGGNVSIAGTLSYDDVTNVDSVGVITARSGIEVGPTSGIGITINSNGSITAAGPVLSGSTSTASGTSGFYNNGTAAAAYIKNFGSGPSLIAEAASSGNAIRVDNSAGTAETVLITGEGSITAAADVFSGALRVNPGNGVGSYLAATNGVLVTTASGIPVFRGYINGTGTPTSQINPDGSTLFKAPSSYGVQVQTVGGNEGTKFPFVGKNTSGTTTFSVNGDGTIVANGSLVASVLRVEDSSSTYPRIIGTPDGTVYSEGSAGSYNWQLAPSGSATFEGDVVVNSNSGGTPKTKLWSDGSASLAEGNISLNGNGSATFTGAINALGGTFTQEVYVDTTSASTQRYLNFKETGTSNYRATLRRDAWCLGDPVTNIGNVTPTGAKLTLKMDGMGVFGDNTTENYTNIYSNGGIRCYRSASGSEVIGAYDPGGAKVQIFMDGSATFTSKVTVQSLQVDGTGGQCTAAYNLVTQNAASSLGLFVGCSNAANASTSNSNGGITGDGALFKTSGTFKINHPLPSKKDTHHLVHSFIEGPQADNIYRGVVTLVAGTATIDLDAAARMSTGTFVLLNTNVSCFTSNETDWTAVRGSVSGSTLVIDAQDNTSTATVSWMVVGERHDQNMIDAAWTDENGRCITEPLKF